MYAEQNTGNPMNGGSKSRRNDENETEQKIDQDQAIRADARWHTQKNVSSLHGYNFATARVYAHPISFARMRPRYSC